MAAALAGAALAACSSSGSDRGSGAHSAHSSTPSATSAPKWGYTDELTPDAWAKAYPGCADTAVSAQSPIDLPAVVPSRTPAVPVRLALKPTSWRVYNNGHTVQAVPVSASGEPSSGSAGAIVVDGKPFDVAQFHFHAQSEHTFSGQHVALEMHVVATASDGATTVLGLPLQVGGGTSALAPIFAALPDKVTDAAQGVLLPTPFDLTAALPVGVQVVRYQGSLTTPPCTEKILWNVYRTPGLISADQARAFTSKYPNDNRPTQPLNGRTLVLETVLPSA